LIENKFHVSTGKPKEAARPAGMQGRRYAISLGSQVVIVVLGYEAKPAQLPNKSQTLSVHGISGSDANRVELRFSLPYGAPSPSGEKEDRAVRH
jgi:hypothetical protein